MNPNNLLTVSIFEHRSRSAVAAVTVDTQTLQPPNQSEILMFLR